MRLDKKIYQGRKINFLRSSAEKPLIQCFIEGLKRDHKHVVINSITEDKEAHYKWKLKIAQEIMSISRPSIQAQNATISLSFLFNPEFHGNRHFDVDNFIKPVIDGVAKGLFGNLINRNSKGKTRFNEDDSVFRWIYLERHDTNSNHEGVYITVWGNKEGSV